MGPGYRLATLIGVVVLAAGCGAVSPSDQRSRDSGAGAVPGTSVAGGSAASAATWPSTATTTSVAPPGPSATPAHGCPYGPCPSNLEFAVNGCNCAGQIYEDSRVRAQYCCQSGFSDSECAEVLEREARAESLFGVSAEDVEAQLVTVTLQGWDVLVHERAAAAFSEAAAKIENVAYRIEEPPESYNLRTVNGRQVLSLHAFGIAVDINPSANPSCGVTAACRCYNDLVTDMPREFVQAFRDAGFDWGGDWVDHPDPMHFEWAGWR